MEEKTDLEKYRECLLWNQQGFYEVEKVLDQLRDFADEYNNKGTFKMKIKDTDESKKLILVIELEK